jgi:hypothetical protein
MLRFIVGVLSLTTALATSAAPANAGLLRLRGGADFKDKATGIIFPDSIKAGGSSLTVRSLHTTIHARCLV